MQYSQLTNEDLQRLLREKNGNLKGICYTVIEDAELYLANYNIHLGNGVFKGNVEVRNHANSIGAFSAGNATFEKPFTIVCDSSEILGAFSLGNATFKDMIDMSKNTFAKDFTCCSATIEKFFNANALFKGDFDVAKAVIKGKVITTHATFRKEVNLVSAA